MTRALKGINLGGWLVAERWMTPALFEGVEGNGERALARELGDRVAAERLKKHRDNFITEGDFEFLAREGFDFVRLPVGYWLFEQAEGFIAGQEYVDRAFRWAKAHDIGILLDLHGLPGSQNGQDHSGQAGKVRFYRWWHRRHAVKVMRYIAQRYGSEPALMAMEIINEPKARMFLWGLLRYYDKAFAAVQDHVNDGVKIIVSDAYEPLRLSRALARRKYGNQLVLDVHLYQVFAADEQQMTLEEHMQKVDHGWGSLIEEVRQNVPLILVGEWSAALPANAYRNLKGGEQANSSLYYRSQKELFDRTVWGHSYWSYKAPGAGAWGWKDQASFRKY